MCLVLTCEKMFHADSDASLRRGFAEVAKNSLAFQDRPLSAFAHALCTLRETISRQARRGFAKKIRRMDGINSNLASS